MSDLFRMSEFTPSSRHFGGIGTRRQSLSRGRGERAQRPAVPVLPALAAAAAPGQKAPQAAARSRSSCAPQPAAPGLAGKRMCSEMRYSSVPVCLPCSDLGWLGSLLYRIMVRFLNGLFAKKELFVS